MPTATITATALCPCGCTGCESCGCTSDDDCPGQYCENGVCTDPWCECCTHADNSTGCASPGWACYDYGVGWRCVECNLSQMEGCIGGNASTSPCAQYDFDRDGDVDFADLATYRGVCCDSGIESCPP